MPSRWYVLRTEPQAEFLATAELERDGFDVFFPRIKTLNPRPGHSESPLFPGYLFLRWNQEAAGWPTFRPGTRVTGWVKFGNDVPWLPDEIVAELAQQQDAINEEGGLFRRFLRGEKVRVVSGSLDSIAEVLEDVKSPKARAKVLMQFMGRLVQAHVPWNTLQPMESTPPVTRRVPRRTRGRGRWINGFGSRAADVV